MAVATFGVTASNTGHILCWETVIDGVVSHLSKKDTTDCHSHSLLTIPVCQFSVSSTEAHGVASEQSYKQYSEEQPHGANALYLALE